MGYWESNVVPKIRKVFAKSNSAKKTADDEACKPFDESKKEVNKFEKKAEGQSKALEVREASSLAIF